MHANDYNRNAHMQRVQCLRIADHAMRSWLQKHYCTRLSQRMSCDDHPIEILGRYMGTIDFKADSTASNLTATLRLSRKSLHRG